VRLSMRTGKVEKVLAVYGESSELEVTMSGGEKAKALNYSSLTGDVEPGDRVLLNTTAVELSLGTGGYHFVYYVFDESTTGREWKAHDEGHIMKLRYTPYQIKSISCEEDESPYHEMLKKADSLEGTPILIVPLHSMLAPAAAAVFERAPDTAGINYIMTDSAALPLPFSRTVYELKGRGFLNNTVTCGHAFGGDFEAVNIYTALLFCHLLNPDYITFISPGPGIVGTGTKFGHTAVEQGEIVNAVSALEGVPVCVPRISFAEQRSRHHVLSHHTVTALKQVAGSSAYIPLPRLDKNKKRMLQKKLTESGLDNIHQLVYEDGEAGISRLKKEQIKVKTMGRTLSEDREFFLTASAGGSFVVQLFKDDDIDYM